LIEKSDGAFLGAVKEQVDRKQGGVLR